MKRITLSLALALAFASAAHAQSSSGGLLVDDAKAGDVITIHSEDTGVRLERTVKDDGKFQFRRIPPGFYLVTVKKPDGTETAGAASVRAGATSRATLEQGTR